MNMRRIIKTMLLLIALMLSICTFAQNVAVTKQLKAKYSIVEYNKSNGGWYLIGKQEGTETLYGFCNKLGKVIAFSGKEYKVYNAFIEFYMPDPALKKAYDEWKKDHDEWKKEYNEYDKLKRQYGLSKVKYIDNDYSITLATYTGEEKTKTIKCSELVEIIEARVEEIFTMIRAGLEDNKVTNIPMSCVITGQGINSINKAEKTAEEILKYTVRYGTLKTAN